jgi:nucleoside-diphosphate-sugar epimerase
VDDVADGIVIAMASAAGLGEDFNLAAGQELTLAEIAAMCADLAPLPAPDDGAVRRHPSVEKAHRLLGWEARIDAREGLPATVAALRERAAEPTI